MIQTPVVAVKLDAVLSNRELGNPPLVDSVGGTFLVVFDPVFVPVHHVRFLVGDQHFERSDDEVGQGIDTVTLVAVISSVALQNRRVTFRGVGILGAFQRLFYGFRAVGRPVGMRRATPPPSGGLNTFSAIAQALS